MLRFTRRSFVGWVGGLVALVGTRRASADATPAAKPGAASAQPVLAQAALLALAEAVLPGELGADGVARVAREFSRWLTEYRSNAEVLHAYGTDDLAWTGPSPAGRWRAQLGGLEREARNRFGSAWSSSSIAQRQELVRAALEAGPSEGLGTPQRANHVAVGLLAFFYASPEATDRCYGVQLGRQQCRPLVHNGREPLPLARGARS